MFDNICRYIAEQFSADLASWLLDQPVALTKLSPSELFLEPIRADALILLQSDTLVLHVEFQTRPDEAIAFRMADYRLRVYRRFPDKRMKQVVVYLKPSRSQLVYQTRFELPNLQHEFGVIRLWEEPTERFLQTPGLLPFAVLTQTDDRAAVLRTVGQRVEALADRRQQSDLAASASLLAGLVLDKELIQRVLRTEMMRESVIYQDIKAEGRAEGEVTGRQKEASSLILRQLNRKLGNLAPEDEERIRELSIEQLETLGEELLTFSELRDLLTWLEQC